MEHLVGLVDQGSASRLTCSLNKVLEISSCLGDTSRVARIGENGEFILAHVIGVGRSEIILFV